MNFLRPLYVFAVMYFTPTLLGGIQTDADMCERVVWEIFWSYTDRQVINHNTDFAE